MGSFVGHNGPRPNETTHCHEKVKPRASQNVKDRNYYSSVVHQKAYKTWASTEKHCNCTSHFNPLIDCGADTWVPTCPRSIAWWNLVRAREGIKLTEEQLFQIGFQ